MGSVIPRKKVLIPRHSEVYGRVNYEARNGRKWLEKKFVLQKILLPQTEKTAYGREFRDFFSIFVPRNGIPSCFLFRGITGNRIPSVCFYFCSMERNSELFSLPRNVSERNSESLLLFCCIVHNS
jgi:hypothetical protein